MKHQLVSGAACTAALALFLLPSCSDDEDGLGGAGGTGGATTTSVATTASATTASVTAAASTSTGMAVCTDDPGDAPCVVCAKDSCCADYLVCEADVECQTCLDCITMSTDPADCVLAGECDLSDPETNAAYGCTAPACADECYAGGFDCTPAPSDDPCVTCIKADCCTQAQACFESAMCAACIQCVQATGDALGCVTAGDCDTVEAATSALFTCANDSCSAQCL